jgi:hypothetical protein
MEPWIFMWGTCTSNKLIVVAFTVANENLQNRVEVILCLVLMEPFFSFFGTATKKFCWATEMLA